MGAFIGLLLLIPFLFFGLDEIAKQLSRIADALEDKETDDDPDNPDDNVAT